MIPEQVKTRFFQAALIASVVTIPLSNNLNSIALIIFVAACLIASNARDLKMNLTTSRFWIIPIIYFLWTVSTYFWDTSGGFTVKELERYAILLFIPPAMAAVPKIPPKTIKFVGMSFIITVVTVCIICLFRSYNQYQVTGDYRVFYYHYLSEQMHLNAIFLSNYCLASITWLLYYGFVEKEKHRAGIYIVIVAAAVFLFTMIFLLSSKLIIFLTVLIILLFVLILGYVRGYLGRALLVTFIVVLAGVVAINNFSYLKWRIDVTEVKMYSGKQDDQNGLAIRLFMWDIAFDHIKERPLLGYGLKGARDKTLTAYNDKGFDLGVTGNYHAHNQYLESTLMAGIPALLLLILFIAAAVRRGAVVKNFLLLLMVFHFAIQSVFESTFEVQHELVFYVFFIFLFYYHAPDNRRISHS